MRNEAIKAIWLLAVSLPVAAVTVGCGGPAASKSPAAVNQNMDQMNQSAVDKENQAAQPAGQYGQPAQYGQPGQYR
jgi:hypothetical protein